jgi:ribulose kinase
MTVNWDAVANVTGEVVTLLGPIASLAVPGAAEAIALGTKILQGVIASEPAAVALYNQILSGTPPTPAQLQQFEADYQDAYATLHRDIAARLAALP